MARWLRSATCTVAGLFVDEPGEWPGIVVPITLSGAPSHQSHTDWPAPMSVELWTAAMPPPFCT